MEKYGMCKQCQSPCHPFGDLCDKCAECLVPVVPKYEDEVAQMEAELDDKWGIYEPI